MLWFRSPDKVYFKKGCLPVAMAELSDKKRAFIVTDSFLYQNGYTKPVEQKLDEMGIQHTTFYDVAPDPSLACAREGAAEMASFRPDLIIAVGGGSAMDTAKAVKALLLAGDMEAVKASRLPEGALPHIAIPGTAGTGAAVRSRTRSIAVTWLSISYRGNTG